MAIKPSRKKNKDPRQRKTTLKWASNGELSAVDMARILESLANPELTECDLTCTLDETHQKQEQKQALDMFGNGTTGKYIGSTD